MEALKEAWEEVRSDKSDVHFLVFKASDDFKTLVMKKSGTGSFADFLAEFDGADTATYGAFRVYAVDQRGSVKSVRAKFVRLSLIPDTLPVIRRAKAGQLKPAVDEVLLGTHASFDISSISEVTPASVEKRLQDTCGAHKPNHYSFEGSGSADGKASAVPGGSMSASQSEAPAAAAAPPPPAAAATTKDEATPAKPEGEPQAPKPVPAAPKVEPPSDIASAWAEVQGSTSLLNWVAVSFNGSDVGTAKMAGGGSGGLAELKESLDPEEIFFCGLRVTAIDDRGSVKSLRAKYVFIQYIGSGVKPMARAKAGPNKGHFEQMLSGTHLSLSISNEDELTAENLETKLQNNCGAHRPNRYEFGKKILDSSELE